MDEGRLGGRLSFFNGRNNASSDAAHASRPGLRRVGLNLRPAVILAGTYRDHVRPVAVEKLSISIVQN
jgi:hypothetical protein